ncbi:MAG: methyltransferase domain-containing protein [bacterium]|nr:methyltransferase domain-containing protein [bacterium]
MESRLRVLVRRHPALRVFLRRYYPPRKALRRIMRPAILWPLLRTVRPISEKYGIDRGVPVDRYYIDAFLAANAHHIRGVCLEVKDGTYTQRYGGDMVDRVDIVDSDRSNPRATIYDDLRHPTVLRDGIYDCIILTQVLQFIDDVDVALRASARLLKPGGTMLVTLPALSRIDLGGGVAGDFWRFTVAGARQLFGRHFTVDRLEIRSWGNVLAGAAFWVGCAQEDCSRANLDYQDDQFPVIISVVARA